jgi:hypothetical protein
MLQFCSVNEIYVKRKSKGEEIRNYGTGEPLFTREAAANDITVSNIDIGYSDGRIFHRLPASKSSYWIMPAVSKVTMAVTPTNSTQFTISVNNTRHNYTNRNFNNIDSLKIMKMIRILGLMAIISYTTVIIFIWIYANLQGYVYFSAGEPISMIKYLEWALGSIGVFVAIDCLHEELNAEKSYNQHV